MRQRFRKFSLTVMIGIVLFSSTVGSIISVQPVSAQAVTVVADVPATVKTIWEKVYDAIKAALISAGIRATSYAIRKVAYDSAVWVASGGKGQNPLAHTNGFGGYLQSVGDEAAGTFIQDMSSKAGVNLCKVPDIKIDLAIKVGLRTKFGGVQAKPACTLSQFTKNWSSGEAWSKFTDPNKLAKSFSASITANDSDLGIYMAATEKINDKVLQQKEAATLDRQEGDGFKALKTLIGDQIKTPAKNISEAAQGLNPQKTLDESTALLNSAIAGGDAKIFPAVLSIFLSTLGGTIINNFQTKGILPFGMCVGGLGGSACKGSGSLAGDQNNPLFNEGGEGLTVLGRAAAKSFFSYFTSVKIKEVNQYDLVSQLNTCPDSPGIHNCRAADELVSAIDQKITIEDAIKTGILDGNRKLIPNSLKTQSLSNDINCFRSAYCLNNVKVLRQLRILPLGFEIAVSLANTDPPYTTLSNVVDAFNDENSPFYHLIDPRWVIKAPEAKCNALVNSQTLLDVGLPTRLQDCVDLQTCVGYSETGNCNEYAYCTREQNSWKFPTDSCAKQFATCKSFQDSKDNTVSYLKRTLDSAYCTADNAGCTGYSLSKNSFGDWQQPQFNAGKNSNTGIFLNSKADTSCSAGSAGCSIYKIASAGTDDYLYLKKAPDYLGCYDSNPNTPNVVDWPQTASDISRLSTNPDCKNYAKACIADEASCNWYTPKNGGLNLPGRFIPAAVSTSSIVWNDQCDARCEGYNVYREMPSNYSNGQDLAYIIPASGKICTAEEEGCSSFTNLSTAVGGVENTEYYNYLRPCITMEEATSTVAKTFITYEGSKENGFQLRTYSMLFNNPADPNFNPSNGVAGSPKYFYKDPTELANLNAECTEQRYKNGVASLDCRQFNDKDGTIYYRMISHTIPANEKCTGFRLNNPEFYVDSTVLTAGSCQVRKGYWNAGQCQMCIQNGEYRNGACVYSGIPSGVESTAGISRSCNASVDTCRAYKGNAGNNIQTVFSENFETSSSTDGWIGGGTRAPVSTHVGEHSFEHSTAGSFSRTLTLEPGKSYDLTFWATAANQTSVTVSLNNGTLPATLNTLGSVSVGGIWRQYHLGPLELKGPNQTVQLTFNQAPAGSLFIDNIKLVKVASYLYLVKNTLSVDPVCDSIPNDNLPGEALGCSAYTDPQNRSFYLTNFSFLCREDAIGCSALFDTFNNESPLPEAYNVWISGNPGSTVSRVVSPLFNPTTSTCKIERKAGQNGCFVDIKGYSSSTILAAIPGGFVSSTIYIPGDTPTSTPIYLVANRQATCNQIDLGCSIAGKQVFGSKGWQYVTTTVKNVPATYGDTLCQSQAAGCSAYSEGDSITYFKDPAIAGQTLCSYQNDVTVRDASNNMVRRNGWFLKKRTGICNNNTSLTCSEGSAAVDCGLEAAVCTDLAYVPCYPADYTDPKTNAGSIGYGLRSTYENGYNNFVGECSPEQDKCTEIVDHAGNSSTEKNYLIFDDRLTSGDCNGQVSQKAGCALFDQVDNPNKFWITTSSYAVSVAAENNLVSPTSSFYGNDANLILKVVPDRSCGEWLACGSSYSVYDSQAGKYRSVCQRIERCDKNGCGGIVTDYNNTLLTQQIYASRSTTWAGMDYAGYSILGMYPLDKIDQVNLSTSTENPDWRLAKKVPCGTTNCTPLSVNAYACGPVIGSGVPYVDGLPCGTATVPGICMNHTCVQPPTGLEGIINPQEFADISPNHICRAYPEANSPFPRTARILAAGSFSGANICDEESGFGCDCSYRKVSYGDAITKFWNYSGSNSIDWRMGNLNNTDPTGICLTGTAAGESCATDSQCPESVCQFKSGTVRKLLGWKGFCLEKDSSRVLNADPATSLCMNWFPVESLAGAADIYSQHVEAGSDWHNTQRNGGNYCISSSGTSTVKNATITFSHNGLTTGSGANNCLGQNDPVFGIPACQTMHCGSNCTNYSYNKSWFARNLIDISSGALNSLTGIKKEDVSVIEIRAVAGTNGPQNLPESGPFYINPNDIPTGDPQSFYRLTNNSGQSAAIVGGFYRKDSNNVILFYSNSDQAPGAGNIGLNVNSGLFDYHFNDTPCHANRTCSSRFDPGLSGDLFDNVTPLKAGTLDTTDIWDRSISNEYDGGNLVGFCPRDSSISDDLQWSDANYEWHAIRFQFDPNTRLLTNIYTADCNPASSGSTIVYQIRFITREWCTDIANDQIDLVKSSGQRAIAWTDRLFSLTKSPTFSVQDLNYKYETTNPAFGSISPVLPSNITSPISIGPVPALDCSPYNNDLSVSNCDLLAKKIADSSYTASSYGTNSSFPLPTVICPPRVCTRRAWWGSCITWFQPACVSSKPATIGNLHLLTVFAAHNSVMSYSTTTIKYEMTTSMPANVTESGDPLNEAILAPIPPEIHPLGQCVLAVGKNNTVYCKELTEKGFSINNSTGTVRSQNVNSQTFSLQFFMFADKNQMPIRSVTINWDDGNSPVPITGFFRNQRGVTSTSPVKLQCTDKNSAIDFGHILDQTCDNTYFQAQNTYTCAGINGRPCADANDHNCVAPSGSALCPAEYQGSGCCIFKPRVIVKDNWGWCNGDCLGANTGCYDALWQTDKVPPGNDLCRSDIPLAGTSFEGKIVVPYKP